MNLDDRVTPIASATSIGEAPTASAADLTVTTVTVGLSWKY